MRKEAQKVEAVSPEKTGREPSNRTKAFTFLLCLETAGMLMWLAGQWQGQAGREAMGSSIGRRKTAAIFVLRWYDTTGVLKGSLLMLFCNLMVSKQKMTEKIPIRRLLQDPGQR